MNTDEYLLKLSLCVHAAMFSHHKVVMYVVLNSPLFKVVKDALTGSTHVYCDY
jgi:hypothetical protein